MRWSSSVCVFEQRLNASATYSCCARYTLFELHAASIPVASNSVSAFRSSPLRIGEWEACCEAASARCAALALPNYIDRKAVEEELWPADFQQHE